MHAYALAGRQHSAGQHLRFLQRPNPHGTSSYVYPTDVVRFQDLKGNITINSASRSNFENFGFSCQSVLVPYWDELGFPMRSV